MIPNPEKYEWCENVAVKQLRMMGRFADKLPQYYSRCIECGNHLLTNEMMDILTHSVSPTALGIRTQPDLFSMTYYETKIPAFRFEVKSWTNPSGNVAVEAIPFGRSKITADRLGDNILYLFVKTVSEIRGEFVEKIDWPNEINISLYHMINGFAKRRWDDNQAKQLEIYLKNIFPMSEVIFSDKPIIKGSCDPWFLIKEKVIKSYSLLDRIDTIKQTKII